LVARRIDGAVQFGAVVADDAADVMPGRQTIGAQFFGKREKVGEFHAHVAADARDRRAPGNIIIGEAVDHRIAKPALVIEDIMCDAERVGDGARIADVLSGATGTRTLGRFAMIVKLKRHADHFGSGARRQRRGDRRIDTTRHGNDDARFARRTVELKQGSGINHRPHIRRHAVACHIYGGAIYGAFSLSGANRVYGYEFLSP